MPRHIGARESLFHICICLATCWDSQKRGHSGSCIKTPEGTKTFTAFFFASFNSIQMKSKPVCGLLHLLCSGTSFYPKGHVFRSAWELKTSILGGLSITPSKSSSPTKPKYLQSSSSFSSTPKSCHTSAHSPFPEHKQFNTLSFPSALATLFLVFLFIQSSWSLQINRAQLHLVSSHLTPSELVPYPTIENRIVSFPGASWGLQ